MLCVYIVLQACAITAGVLDRFFSFLVDLCAGLGQERTKNAQFIVISLRNHMRLGMFWSPTHWFQVIKSKQICRWRNGWAGSVLGYVGQHSPTIEVRAGGSWVKRWIEMLGLFQFLVQWGVFKDLPFHPVNLFRMFLKSKVDSLFLTNRRSISRNHQQFNHK